MYSLYYNHLAGTSQNASNALGLTGLLIVIMVAVIFLGVWLRRHIH